MTGNNQIESSAATTTQPMWGDCDCTVRFRTPPHFTAYVPCAIATFPGQHCYLWIARFVPFPEYSTIVDRNDKIVYVYPMTLETISQHLIAHFEHWSVSKSIKIGFTVTLLRCAAALTPTLASISPLRNLSVLKCRVPVFCRCGLESMLFATAWKSGISNVDDLANITRFQRSG